MEILFYRKINPKSTFLKGVFYALNKERNSKKSVNCTQNKKMKRILLAMMLGIGALGFAQSDKEIV